MEARKLLGAILLVILSSIADGLAPLTAADETGVIEGAVTSSLGPEAGVWVIAETRDLPTPFVKIVVTDDQGQYVLPELPNARYQVWARGYGLLDSPKVMAIPGTRLNLSPSVASTPAAAAQYYPAGYWFSLLRMPGKEEFPGTGPEGNGIPAAMQNQGQWLRLIKSDSCWSCHVVGNKATRELPEGLGSFESTKAAWEHRVQAGQAGPNMLGTIGLLGRDRALQMFADWTDRIKAGAVPPAPSRPQGVERNLVITQWDWADHKGYLHDLVSTDRRNPTVNPHGKLYGAMEFSADYTPVLDPVRHIASRVDIGPRDPSTPPAVQQAVLKPSPYYGEEVLWNSRANVHNPMLDEMGRLWLTAIIRPPQTPAFCRAGSGHPSAQAFPINNANRQLALYDPQTNVYTHVDTCFSTHHLMFAEDDDDTIWTSGGGQVIGWLNSKKFLETGDAAASQGWSAFILDTNGNGQRDAYVEPNEPIDPAKDKRISTGSYGVAPAVDGSVWISYQGSPGGVMRVWPGDNPPFTTLTENFEPPYNNPNVPTIGFSPRGMDVDRNGVVWMPMASGHMASFDRSKCMGPLNGPDATGQHCPEGWSFYVEPVPQLEGVTDPGSGGVSYYLWVDQFNTLGLGENVPINTGNAAEALLALKDGQWVQLRVPYPMGFFVKWMDGRIDDPNAGWKGRGLWTTFAGRAPVHMETGKGTTPKVMHFQLRGDPLER